MLRSFEFSDQINMFVFGLQLLPRTISMMLIKVRNKTHNSRRKEKLNWKIGLRFNLCDVCACFANMDISKGIVDETKSDKAS